MIHGGIGSTQVQPAATGVTVAVTARRHYYKLDEHTALPLVTTAMRQILFPKDR